MTRTNRRVQYQSTAGDGYALARPHETDRQAVQRSLARRLRRDVVLNVDSQAMDHSYTEMEARVMDAPTVVNGVDFGRAFRNERVTVYHEDAR